MGEQILKKKNPVVWKNKNNRSCQDLGTKGRIYPYFKNFYDTKLSKLS